MTRYPERRKRCKRIRLVVKTGQVLNPIMVMEDGSPVPAYVIAPPGARTHGREFCTNIFDEDELVALAKQLRHKIRVKSEDGLRRGMRSLARPESDVDYIEIDGKRVWDHAARAAA